MKIENQSNLNRKNSDWIRLDLTLKPNQLHKQITKPKRLNQIIFLQKTKPIQSTNTLPTRIAFDGVEAQSHPFSSVDMLMWARLLWIVNCDFEVSRIMNKKQLEWNSVKREEEHKQSIFHQLFFLGKFRHQL